MITHGAIVPKVGLQTIRLANYVQYLPKGTRLQISFGPSSSSGDIAYLGFGDETADLAGAGGALAADADEAGQRLRAGDRRYPRQLSSRPPSHHSQFKLSTSVERKGKA